MSTVSRFLRSVPYTSILKPRYNHGHFSTKPSHLSNLKEKRVRIDDWLVNWYQLGSGPHHILCVPASFGTAWTDFKLQIEGFDLDKFTLVTYDTPGFGKSSPPERDFRKDLHHTDADILYKLMKVIDIPKYSLMGWSYGSTASLIHAAKYPDAVEKLVVWGAQSHLLPRECINYEKLKEQSLKQPLAVLNTRVEYYGKEIANKQMAAVFDAMVAKYTPLGGEICSAMLPNIRCPTFILYGAKDGITDSSHVTYLNHHIKNSRVFVYPEGKHAIHMRFADDFNRRVQEFLLEPTCDLDSN